LQKRRLQLMSVSPPHEIAACGQDFVLPMMRISLRVLISGLALSVFLAGCATGNNKRAESVMLPTDPQAQRGQLRQSGAKETRLAAFCKAPPQGQSAAATATIKSDCDRLLPLTPDASVFEKGNGVYVVSFQRGLTQAELCGGGQSNKGFCMGLVPGDTLTTMHFVAR
jgi:hypothetical protein